MVEELLSEVEKILNPKILELTNLSLYQKRAEKVSTKLLSIRQAHIGTDKSVFLIKNLNSKLEKSGVLIKRECEVFAIEKNILKTENGEYLFKNVLIAPGRKGFSFLQNLMSQMGIDYVDNVVDVGIRLETKISHYPIVKDYYDPKFYFPNGVRTFCTNSKNAFVTVEKYKNFKIINGHALSGERGENGYTNFALLKTIKLKNPVRSGQKMATFLARLANEIGGGKPIMQRIGDFRAGRRSKKETFNFDLYNFKPTCNVCAGDLGLAVPSNIMRDIWAAIKRLDTVSPGVMHPSTIMYYPEIKMYANRPRFIDDNFRVSKNTYMAGDGAGTSRGITGAWASGIRVARGILAKL